MFRYTVSIINFATTRYQQIVSRTSPHYTLCAVTRLKQTPI